MCVCVCEYVCDCVKERDRLRVFLSFLKSVAIILHFQPTRHATRRVLNFPMHFFQRFYSFTRSVLTWFHDSGNKDQKHKIKKTALTKI